MTCWKLCSLLFQPKSLHVRLDLQRSETTDGQNTTYFHQRAPCTNNNATWRYNKTFSARDLTLRMHAVVQQSCWFSSPTLCYQSAISKHSPRTDYQPVPVAAFRQLVTSKNPFTKLYHTLSYHLFLFWSYHLATRPHFRGLRILLPRHATRNDAFSATFFRTRSWSIYAVCEI